MFAKVPTENSLNRLTVKIRNLNNGKLLVLFLIQSLFISNATAQSLYTNASGGTATAQNTAVNIASALTVGTGATPLTAATVSISGNFVSGQDYLKINGLSSGSDGTIAFSYNSTSGVMSLTGAATEAQYETTLRKITYTNSAASPNTGSRTISFSLNAALPYSGNGHYYEFISSSGISWTSARDDAAAKTYFGLQGYLVTSTSAGENTFISSKLSGQQGWLGASDATTEGNWKWVTGPESGTQFWSGSSGGSTVGGNFADWNSGEPNNSGDEDYGQFVPSGKWNDLPVSNASIVGYVVEFGGMAGDPVIHISDVSAVTISYAPLAPTGITGTSTICNGFSTELTASGAVGAVYWYTGSCGGTQIGTGNTIAVSPTTTTTYYARNYNNAQYSVACASLTVNVNQPSFVSDSRTLADLQVTGTGIQWYAASSGGSPLTIGTSLVNGTTYYASQTVNGVESTDRMAVTATLDETPCSPTGSGAQTLSSGSTVANLSAIGQSIRWYTVSTGGTALDPATVLVNGTHYWASQTVDCTESATRLEVVVTMY